MTKRDYELIADALNKASKVCVEDNFQRGKVIGVKVAISYIADALQADNPAFKYDTFVERATR